MVGSSRRVGPSGGLVRGAGFVRLGHGWPIRLVTGGGGVAVTGCRSASARAAYGSAHRWPIRAGFHVAGMRGSAAPRTSRASAVGQHRDTSGTARPAQAQPVGRGPPAGRVARRGPRLGAAVGAARAALPRWRWPDPVEGFAGAAVGAEPREVCRAGCFAPPPLRPRPVDPPAPEVRRRPPPDCGAPVGNATGTTASRGALGPTMSVIAASPERT